MSHLCVTGLQIPIHVPYRYPLTSSSPPYSWGALIAQKKKQSLIIQSNRLDLLQGKIKTIDTIVFEFRTSLDLADRKREWEEFKMISNYASGYQLPVLGITTYPNMFQSQPTKATFVCERPSSPSELDSALDSCLEMRRVPNKRPYIRARNCSPEFHVAIKKRARETAGTKYYDIKAMHPKHKDNPLMRAKHTYDAGQFKFIRYADPNFRSLTAEGYYLIPKGDLFTDDILPLALSLYSWREDNEDGKKTTFELQVW